MRAPQRYSDPYLAGIGIGLVLLAAYVLIGRGLGASGAFSSMVAASAASVVGTTEAARSPGLAPYLVDGIAGPLGDWLVLELIGVIAGGFASALLAGRLRRTTERGPHLAPAPRLLAAVGGGVLMGWVQSSPVAAPAARR